VTWSVAAVAAATVAAALAAVHGLMLALGVGAQTGTWIVHVPVRPTGQMPPTAFDASPAGWPSPVQAGPDGVDLWLKQTDGPTAMLAGAEQWVTWFVLAAVILTLVPTVRGLGAGRWLTVANGTRVAGLGGIVLLGWAAAYGLPYLAAGRAIAAQDSGLPAAWFDAGFRPAWWPVVLVGLLLVLGLVLRRGAVAAQQAEGLV
jgi:hypothetical protein